MENKILIKPHHFLDIIKLYGAGLDVFVPDEKMGHDFYRIGNIILKNKDVGIRLTIDSDDICTPCKYCKNNLCVDKLDNIAGYTKKDTYNKTLDRRIVEYFSLDLDRDYIAYELCSIYLSDVDFIYQVWQEEDDEKTKERYRLFSIGAKKYIPKK